MLELVASHQLAPWKAAWRSLWGSSPPIGETSRGDGVAVQAGQDAVQAEHVAVFDKRVPAVNFAPVGLACDAATEPLKVALDGGMPLLEAARSEVAD